MRFLVFGAGAIGTYVGGSLALQDNAVVFLERPDFGVELRQRGLRLKLDGQERRIENPHVSISLEEAFAGGPFDAAVFALKSYDTQAALQTLAFYKESLPPMLCLQNGVENEPLLAETLGSDKVIAGTVTSSIGRRAVGDTVLERLLGIRVAEGQELRPPHPPPPPRRKIGRESDMGSERAAQARARTGVPGRFTTLIPWASMTANASRNWAISRRYKPG